MLLGDGPTDVAVMETLLSRLQPIVMSASVAHPSYALGGPCSPAGKSIIMLFDDGDVTMAMTTTMSTPLVLVPTLATFVRALLFVILFGAAATGVTVLGGSCISAERSIIVVSQIGDGDAR